ncbi:murein hydrolase activator EnvC family protein [Aureimonas psammosilenae]|uniref:murein hydrolase activator EnvC family protein n=1 Tax=Aureimonas psammosilenae TaxID=2495496 RepID=UPI001869BA39|nr:peptidoglycan DD-metalloendopeptidase family protein [Aureimonas psammosilenae]
MRSGRSAKLKSSARVCLVRAGWIALGLLSAMPSVAAAPDLDAVPVGPPRSIAIEAERNRTADQLASISASISLTREGIAKLDAEIAGIAADRDRIRQAMIDAAAAQKALALDVSQTEGRIEGLAGEEGELKASLRSRRGLLAEVLGALERIGRKPPPALLVKPDDALGSVRSAILLGAVVPGIRQETEKLVADLEQLAQVKRDIASEKARYVASLTQKREEEERLARLFTEKERLEQGSRDRRESERRRAADLASKATSLQDLVAALEADATVARAAEEAAIAAARRQAEPAAKEQAQPMPPDERGDAGEREVAALPPEGQTPSQSYDIASLRRDMGRIEPVAAFSTLKKRLTPPVAGGVLTRFGESDGIGRPSAGMFFLAKAGDIVTAPADGQVLYSGPFRSYGELLILDAGDGYHVVLAGMSRSDVEVGQGVLAGEPVAVMGARRVASASGLEFEASEPSLYVEFRKDGKPVDPSPWWTSRLSGRTRNDT